MRFLPSVSREKLKFLAEVAEPDIEVTVVNETRRDLLRRHYGSSVQKIRQLFAQYNPKLPANVIPAGTRVVFPAAPYWAFNVVKKVVCSLKEVVAVEMGYAGPVTMREIRALNPAPKPGRPWTVRLPYTTKARTFRLKKRFETSGEKVRRKLYARWMKDDVAHDVGGALSLISDFADAAEGSTCFAFDPATWLGRELSEANAPYAAGMQRKNVLVAILDSGLLDTNDPRFILWHNFEELKGSPTEDVDKDGYVHDVIGYDFAENRSLPLDDLRTQQRGHGEHVAGIASGRLSVAQALKGLDESVELMILKIADANGAVPPDAVTNAIKLADDHLADIANLSLEGLSSTVRDAIVGRHRILFIVAAGNGDKNHLPIDLDETDVFPATLGRDQENVITVAASGPDLKPACFSNRGKNTVTLAAPGIAIDSTYDQGDKRMSGTSQATPLVTLIAALIMSKGLREPTLVKQRIMASVDFDRGLEKDVITSGRLNIRKALALFDDLIQLRSGEILLGSIDPSTIIEISDREFSIGSIAKMVRYSDDTGHHHRVIQMSRGRQTFVEGDIKTPGITIRLQTADHSVQKRTIPIDEIEDFVPASLPRPR